MPPKHDDFFYLEHMTFLVEDTLFRVDKRSFEKSEIFRTTFSLPTGGGNAEGTSDHKPFILEHIKAADFRAFLRVLTPMEGRGTPDMSAGEWKSALALATMWDFSDVRGQAIKALSSSMLGKSPVDKVLLGRQFNHGAWLMEGYRALVCRGTVMGSQEMDEVAKALGWRTTARLLRLRHRHAQNSVPVSRKRKTWGDTLTCCENEIRAQFPDEFGTSIEVEETLNGASSDGFTEYGSKGSRLTLF